MRVPIILKRTIKARTDQLLEAIIRWTENRGSKPILPTTSDGRGGGGGRAE